MPTKSSGRGLSKNHAFLGGSRSSRLTGRCSGFIENYPQSVIETNLVTGFDEDRTKYMLYKYEPQKVYLLVQEGEQFNNKQRNNESAHRLVCEDFGLNKENIISKQIDSYSPDFGFEVIESVINEENQSNIILASFGPKPSAIAAYRCYMKHSEIALCYLPCKDYNVDYCQGIGESLSYTLEFPKED